MAIEMPNNWRELDLKKVIGLAKVHYQSKTKPGFFIDPITWQVLRIALSAIGAVLSTVGLVFLDWILGANLVAWWLVPLMIFFLGWHFYQDDLPEDQAENVPYAFGALVTFFGMPVRIPGFGPVYRTTGEYQWLGNKLRIDRLRVVKEPGTDNTGLHFFGNINMAIWNTSDQNPDSPNARLSNRAKNTAAVFTSLVLTFELREPLKWIRNTQPMLAIGERARSAIRSVVAFFIDSDSIVLKSVLGKLMSGSKVITCFLLKPVREHLAGAVARDHGERAIYAVVEPKGDVEAGKQWCLDRITTDTPDDIQRALRLPNGSYRQPDVLEVEESLTEVIEDVGGFLIASSVGDVDVSEEVGKYADRASSEAFQALARIRSAEIMKRVQLMLSGAKTEDGTPISALEKAMAALQDEVPGIQVVVHEGAGDLGSSIITAARQNQGGNNK